LVSELLRQPAPIASELEHRGVTAAGKGGHGAEKIGQLAAAARIEAAIGAPAQFGQLAECHFGIWVMAFLKDKEGRIEDAQFSCQVTERVGVFFDTITYVYDGMNAFPTGLLEGMFQHATNLR
jgi:hypothetical protein